MFVVVAWWMGLPDSRHLNIKGFVQFLSMGRFVGLFRREEFSCFFFSFLRFTVLFWLFVLLWLFILWFLFVLWICWDWLWRSNGFILILLIRCVLVLSQLFRIVDQTGKIFVIRGVIYDNSHENNQYSNTDDDSNSIAYHFGTAASFMYDRFFFYLILGHNRVNGDSCFWLHYLNVGGLHFDLVFFFVHCYNS